MRNQGVILLFIYFENKDMMKVMDMMKVIAGGCSQVIGIFIP